MCLVVCVNHNSFDVPVLDVFNVGYFFYVMTLFTSQYYIHVLVVCDDHNSFDVPVLDVFNVGYFLLCYAIFHKLILHTYFSGMC
jgi:hypothetical protein